jgi:hypothetical protein
MSFTDTIEQVAMALSGPALWKKSALKRNYRVSLGTKVDWQRRVCGLNLGEYNE